MKSLKNSLMLRSSSLDFFLRGVPVVQLSLDARLKYLMFAPSISRAPEGVSSMLSYYYDYAMSSTSVMSMCSEQLCWIFRGARSEVSDLGFATFSLSLWCPKSSKDFPNSNASTGNRTHVSQSVELHRTLEGRSTD